MLQNPEHLKNFTGYLVGSQLLHHIHHLYHPYSQYYKLCKLYLFPNTENIANKLEQIQNTAIRFALGVCKALQPTFFKLSQSYLQLLLKELNFFF